MPLSRRSFLGSSVAGAAALTFGPAFWRSVYADVAVAGDGPYGALQAADPVTGLQLPAGFSSRIVAVAGVPVARGAGGATGYPWHIDPDGGAVFDQPDGGWVYASNCEETPGGAGAIRFDANGEVVDAYRILDGTRNNCAGGPTPWGTWLSCEESGYGYVWECGVTGPGEGTVLPAMGAFNHEAVAVDPVREQLYLTEDATDGRLYRYTPLAYPDLTAGTLEAAALTTPVPGDLEATRTWSSAVTWVPVSAAGPASFQPQAVTSTTAFQGGEGIWYDGDHVYFVTKGDNRVWDLDAAAQTLTLLYDDAFWPAGEAPLTGVDNITVSPFGDIYVAEDGPNPSELVLLSIVDGVREVTQFLRIADHTGTELAGPAFTADGTRLYVSSQRGPSPVAAMRGITYEITGPFRGTVAAEPDPGPSRPGKGNGRDKDKGGGRR